MTMGIAHYFALAVPLVVLGAGAGAATQAKEGILPGTSWQLVQLGPNGALMGAHPTLSFLPDGKVSGSGGCNTFTGSVTVAGRVVTFSGLAATKKSCGEQVDKQEATFLKALGEAQEVQFDDTDLNIITKTFAEPLSFVPAKK